MDRSLLLTLTGLLTLLLWAGDVWAAPLDPALVAWYGFEAIQDGRIADLSGHGLDLVVVNTVGLGEGKAGRAAEFTGQGYLETPDHPRLGLTGSLTLECWVWLPAGGSAGRLIDKGYVGKNGAYMLDLWPGNALRFIGRDAFSAPVKLSAEAWHHAVVIRDDREGREAIYLDGQMVAERTAGFGELPPTPLPLRLGADSNATSLLQGSLDEVRIYARALDPAEIAARYAGREVYRPAPPPPPPPAARPVAYRDGRLRVDYAALVGHNDVVYLTPALYPFEALPLGNGNLGVTLWNEGGVYLKFNNGSFWRAKEMMQCSSGEAQLTDTPSLLTATDFKQRLSLYDGVVYTRAVTPEGTVVITSFATEGDDMLVVHVVDGRKGPVSRKLTLSHWREDVKFSAEGGMVAMTSASGLLPDKPPVTGRPQPTTAVLAACAEGIVARASGPEEKTVTLVLAEGGPVEYTLYFAAPAVKPDQGDALAYARGRLDAAKQRGWRELLAEHKRYWADFWSKSALYLAGPDATAEYFAQLWYLNLYWAGCQSRGPYCPKFNGGNFLLEKDQRTWGGSYWYQNTREMFWCLPAANHPELVQPLYDLYKSLLPENRRMAKEHFHAGGIQVQETISQFGSGTGGPFTHLVLTDGLETALEFHKWYRHTGDERLWREELYPYMKEAVQFFLDYAKRGEDGKWHIYPTNSRETWWRVQDAAPDLYGLRAVLPILLRESERLGRDAELRPVWQEFLDNLAEYPVDPETGALAPCRFLADPPPTDLARVEAMYKDKNVSRSAKDRKNCECPECELLYPWDLAGIGSANYEQAKKTFEVRKWCACGWDPAGIWAARLGLADEALKILLGHGANQRWPQGWWNTPSGTRWVKALIDVPGFDSSGTNATTLTEMCLQSYGSKIRVWPAFPGAWSGLLRLRAEGGFMVTSEIAAGEVRYVVIESERGEECRIVNPWAGTARVTGPTGFRRESAARELVFPTRPGATYLLEPVAVPLSGRPWAELKPARSEGPRWPGQTSPQQQWRPGQPIMIGLAKDGHPLRVRVEAAAAAAPPQP